MAGFTAWMGRNYRALQSVASLPMVMVLLVVVALLTVAKLQHETLELSVGWMALIGPACVMLALGLFRLRRLLWHWGFWAVLALTSLAHIYRDWPGPANHTYAFLYLCLIMVLVMLNQQQERASLLQSNTRWLFAAIMLLAVLQKVITPGYLDGSINAFWLATGGYGKPLYAQSEAWQEVVQHNYALLDHYFNQTPYAVQAIEFRAPVSNLRFWGQMVSAGILLGEVVVPLVFLFARNALVKHLSLLLFVVGVFFIRQETGFLSLLCILGLAQIPDGTSGWRLAYLGVIAVMQTLFLLGYGYI